MQQEGNARRKPDYDTNFDIVIVGGGVSGTALLYTLARYTSARRVLLLEKHDAVGRVNSHAQNNSQTLHVGDIESNYSVEKARQVKPAALMVAAYASALPKEERSKILYPVQKMILAVGAREVEELGRRFEDLRALFPNLQRLDREGIEKVEPMIVRERDPEAPLLALATPGYAVDYERLAESFVRHARTSRDPGRATEVRLGAPVRDIRREGGGWALELPSGEVVRARAVVVNADAYSLLFAKRLGYGKEFSLIPVAGTFYFSKRVLRGKVYTMQNPRLPFAAVHGDPDVRVPGKTRWGPTARFFPVLESRRLETMGDYFRVSGLHRPKTWASFFCILLEPIRFFYLLKNLLYEIPFVGIHLYAREVRKVVPSMRGGDLRRAKGFGGMRLQRVNTETRELLLGEGKIIAENIIFNMTPSPGASVCLYNALRDAGELAKFLGPEYRFDKAKMERELCPEARLTELTDTSLKDTYAS